MINSFEGHYKSRRTINLGGRRQQEDREALVKKTHDQRKAREKERLKQKSAIKIQAFYRGRTTAGTFRDNERKSWDQQIKFMINNVYSERDLALNLINLVRSFLFFYRSHYDAQRKLNLNQMLRKQTKGLEAVFFPFYYDDLRDLWTYQLKRTLVIFLKNLEINTMQPYQSIYNLETLLLSMNISKYQKIQNINRELVTLSRNFRIPCKEWLIRRIEKYFDQHEDKDNPVILPLVELALHPLQISSSSHQIYDSFLQNFITHIFTIPLIPNRINIETLKIFSSRLPLNDIILKLSTMVGAVEDIEQGCVLFGNLLAFAHQKVSKMKINVMLAYMKTIQNLALRIPTQLLIDKSENSNDALPKVDPRILKWISRLFDKEHLASFFALVASSAIFGVSNFFITLMIRWPSKKVVLLNNMIYGKRPVVSLLWGAFENTELAQLLTNNKSNSNTMTDPTFSEQWGLFALLCEVYSRVLFTMGDDEFFDERKNPLRLSEIIKMSTCMKHVGFLIYWNRNNSPPLKMDVRIESSCIDLYYLRDIVTKLLRQIHARDSRRQFTPTDHWLMTSEIDMNVFVKIVVLDEQDLEYDSDDEACNLDKMQIANISPRLGILYNIPFVIPFEERVKIFREFVQNDRERNINRADLFMQPRARVSIRRNSVFEDGFSNLNALGSGLKSPIAIQFIDEFGMQEAGIDGGGLFKEFLTSLTRIAFDTNYGLFLSTKEQLLYPNPYAFSSQEQLSYYGFIGRILGKALYEGILVDAAFAGFFLNKWLGRTSYLDDLPSLDPELYQGLIYLKNYQGDVESDLSLNFTVVNNELGVSRTIELIPGGSDIPVTNENRISYIHRVADYRLNKQIELQCGAFFGGLLDLINQKWLMMFNQEELQILVGGAYIPINIEDLKQNTEYSDYKEDDPVIINFWKVVTEFPEEQKQKLIKFVTSCSRPPLLGFKELHPKFSIRKAGSGTRLPSSSTCVNLLKLPAYSDENTLREKLSYAINADVGFDLS
ncbi:9918_t:CDS:10 [Funneliformis caledonium]|uniref:HECT-type E3 ubiquitin transferase n=1 Tax=Funneliformis caledonium TaxID=1117310 RepID=A0A9N8YNT7_9GLOM|nr:9918_t:CDS:10 [Funneliformis caledonium]